MIVLDANVLLYAYNASAAQHQRARAWVEQAFSGVEPIGLPWFTISAFLRISTHLKVFAQPFSASEAAEIVGSWFDAPAVAALEPGDRFWEIFSKLMVDSQVSGALVSDAVLAAIAIEHGAHLATTDRDFRRFDGLKLLDPVTGGS